MLDFDENIHKQGFVFVFVVIFYINNVVGWADVDPTFQQENRKWLIADSVLLESEIKDLIESGLKEHIL